MEEGPDKIEYVINIVERGMVVILLSRCRFINKIFLQVIRNRVNVVLKLVPCPIRLRSISWDKVALMRIRIVPFLQFYFPPLTFKVFRIIDSRRERTYIS